MWLTPEVKDVLQDFVITHDGRDLSEFFIPQAIEGRDFQEHEFTWLDIPFRDGAIITSRKVRAVPLTLTGIIACTSAEELREIVEFLNEFLYTEDTVPMTFSDETDRTYYVMFQSASTEMLNGSDNWMQATLTFARPDPYKYGSEMSAEFVDGAATVLNRGTASAYPRYELEATGPVSHVDVIGENNYIRTGIADTATETPYERMTLVRSSPLTSLVGWTTASEVDNGYVTGNMIATPVGMRAELYGGALSPLAYQGPAVRTSLPEALQNFRIDLEVDFFNTSAQTGMIEVYCKDAGGNTVAKIGIEDVWTSLAQIQAKFQVGEIGLDGKRAVDYRRVADRPSAWNNFKGVIRLNRDGNRFRPYFAIFRRDRNGNIVHDWVAQDFLYVDEEAVHLAPITEVVIAIRKWPLTTESAIVVRNFKAWRYNSPSTGVPVIADAGDLIVFDTQSGELTINGESVTRDLGSDLFKLPKGESTIFLEPADKLIGHVRFRERFR